MLVRGFYTSLPSLSGSGRRTLPPRANIRGFDLNMQRKIDAAITRSFVNTDS